MYRVSGQEYCKYFLGTGGVTAGRAGALVDVGEGVVSGGGRYSGGGGGGR